MRNPRLPLPRTARRSSKSACKRLIRVTQRCNTSPAAIISGLWLIYCWKRRKTWVYIYQLLGSELVRIRMDRGILRAAAKHGRGGTENIVRVLMERTTVLLNLHLERNIWNCCTNRKHNCRWNAFRAVFRPTGNDQTDWRSAKWYC